MVYQVTARKWRPQRFSDVVGQEGITTALKNSIIKGKIPHALLFSGVRGVGKTTTARIFAKALNCKNLQPDGEPCNKCDSCVEITNGFSVNVIEIDGASNRGIENIRDIKDNTIYAPINGKYRIYIIDEVHMLTTEASNALLKTLAEPPSHVVFILATTEAHKILPTIKSRCQHYHFKKMHNKTIVEQLKKISSAEKIKFSEDALYLIAEYADGSMRDAESIFDQIALFTDGNISDENVKSLLGVPDDKYFFDILNAALKNDFITALNVLNNYYDENGELKQFLRNFITFLKEGLMVKKLEFNSDLIDFSETKYNNLKALFNKFSEGEITTIIDLLVDLFKEMRGEVGEKFLFEITLFKLIDYKNIVKLSDIKDELIKYLEDKEVTSTEKKEIEVKQPIIKSLDSSITTINEKKQDFMAPTDDNIKNTFLKMISENSLTKPMISHISTIKCENQNIYIEFSKPHTIEYFNSKKEAIEKKLSEIFGSKIGLHFSISKETNVDLTLFEKKASDYSTAKPKNIKELIVKEFEGKIIKE
ncbi:MAG: DNA polymerase III subunit gamma/tau [Brevinematales bacterium]|nr:DNA polymerase III subunit gamma/tau [Brevinematales bacterium]